MRFLSAAVIAASLTSTTVHAAVVDLTYTITSEVTKAELYGEGYFEEGYPYEYTGPEAGDILTWTHRISLDPDVSYASLPGGWVHSYNAFDPATGAHAYTRHWSMDDAFNLLLADDGTGSIFKSVSYSGLTGHEEWHDVLGWTVEGLPENTQESEIAITPLPASLPFLAVGMAIMGLATRRRAV